MYVPTNNRIKSAGKNKSSIYTVKFFSATIECLFLWKNSRVPIVDGLITLETNTHYNSPMSFFQKKKKKTLPTSSKIKLLINHH